MLAKCAVDGIVKVSAITFSTTLRCYAHSFAVMMYMLKKIKLYKQLPDILKLRKWSFKIV